MRLAASSRYARCAVAERTPEEGNAGGSSAEKGGLRAGDRIVRINGRAVSEMTGDERGDAMKKSPLKLRVQRGGEAVDLTLSLED